MDIRPFSTNPNRTVRWLMVQVGSQQIIYSDPSVIPALTRCTTDKAIPHCCSGTKSILSCYFRKWKQRNKKKCFTVANACLMERRRIMGTRTVSIIQKKKRKKEWDVRHFPTRQDSISCIKMIFMLVHAKQRNRGRLFKYFLCLHKHGSDDAKLNPLWKRSALHKQRMMLFNALRSE